MRVHRDARGLLLCLAQAASPFEQGVLCEPLAIAVYAIRWPAWQPVRTVAILGAGPIGLSCLVSAKAAGAGRCFVTDLIPERLTAARQQGAAWAGHPQKEDVVAAIRDLQPQWRGRRVRVCRPAGDDRPGRWICSSRAAD